MSRHWTEKQYISADNFWSFIDQVSSRLELLTQHDSIESSELCKLALLGRREMLDSVCDFVHENETTLREIVADQGVLSDEEIAKCIKEECGM